MPIEDLIAIRRLYQTAITVMQELGAQLVPVSVPKVRRGVPSVLAQEFKRDLNRYLARGPAHAPIRSLNDIIAFNAAHPAATRYGQGLLFASQATDLSDPKQAALYVAHRDRGRRAARAALDDVLAAHRGDGPGPRAALARAEATAADDSYAGRRGRQDTRRGSQ
jgi:amidase